MDAVTVTREDWGKLLLRLAVGGLLLFHGVAKVQYGVGGIEGAMVGAGLPAGLAYGAYLGELVAPLLILAGVATRLAGLLVAGTMSVAIYTVHLGDLASLGEHGGWALELPALYLLGGLALALLGAGRLGLGRR